jgi:integrase
LFAVFKMIFGWGIDAGGYGLEHDPLARVRKVRRLGSPIRRDRTLSDEELVALVLGIERLGAPHRQLYGVLLHSGLRLNEVGKAKWSEIAGDTWAVPATRMKGKNEGNRQAREHLVPITSALSRLFASLPRGVGSDFVFRGLKGGSPITAGTSYVRRRLDAEMLSILRQRAQARGENPDKVVLDPWRNHDIRRTCRSTLSRLGVRHEVAEAVLAHARPGVVGVYDKWGYLPEKREALEQWSAFLADLIRPQPIETARRKRVNVSA